MHRSLLCILRGQIKVGLTKTSENGRSCLQMRPKPISSSVPVNKYIHTSVRLQTSSDENNKKPIQTKSKSPKKNKNVRLTPEEEQLEKAAVKAAQGLPGDWTRTADELMARLNVQAEAPGPEHPEQEQQEQPQKSLLSTMKVGRSFERTKPGQRPDSREAMQDKTMMRKRLARKTERFTTLYSQPRLGIFDAEKLKVEGKVQKADEPERVNLWHVVAQEKLEKGRNSLPRNGFEEMAKWTREGRVWSFPVDNEEGMDEERQYKFHDHVFLTHHLKEFPSEGPIRKFMDLVVIGLSKNPWLSVPEKVEHIHWYADYFRQKQELLKSSIGDKAKMRQ